MDRVVPPAEVLYHIAIAADWAQARRDGEYRMSTRGRTLAAEGYLHASTASQVIPVASAYYQDEQADLLLLVLDPARIGAEIRWEQVPGSAERFPHIYGPLPVAAVRRPSRSTATSPASSASRSCSVMTWGHRYGHRLRRGRTGELYLDKPHEVQRYRDAHAAILGCSLDEAATQDLPLTVANELDGASQAHLLSGVSRHILFGTGGITQPDAEGPAVMQNDVRVSDADREAVASRLREHYAAQAQPGRVPGPAGRGVQGAGGRRTEHGHRWPAARGRGAPARGAVGRLPGGWLPGRRLFAERRADAGGHGPGRPPGAAGVRAHDWRSAAGSRAADHGVHGARRAVRRGSGRAAGHPGRRRGRCAA